MIHARSRFDNARALVVGQRHQERRCQGGAGGAFDGGAAGPQAAKSTANRGDMPAASPGTPGNRRPLASRAKEGAIQPVP